MRNFKKLPLIILVIFIISISFGQTLWMYFWQDDAAVIFKLQHLAEPAGSYGSGPFGEGPYKYTITPFVPFYQFFGLNPFGYFLVGLLLYLISVVCIYFLAKDFFDNKKAAFFSTLVFAAGYIGSNSLFKISNSWQNSLGLSLALLMLWSLVKFLKKNQFKFYVLSLFLFFISVHFVFIRSHSLIFLVLILDVIFKLIPFKTLEFVKFILRQIPFWIIFYIYYLKAETVSTAAFSGIKNYLIQGKIEFFSTLFATTGNIFFPNNFQNWLVNLFSTNVQILTLLFFSLSAWLIYSFFGIKKITKFVTILLFFSCFMLNKYFYHQNLYWYRNSENLLSGALGMYTVIFILVLSFSLWRNFKFLAWGLLWGLFIVVTQISGYFIQYPEAIFDTTHRYLYYASVGYAFILGSLAYLSYSILKNKKIFKKYTLFPFLPIFLIILINTLLGFRYQHAFVAEKSQPTQKFYVDLKREVPKFEKGSIFYFDIASDNKSQTQFRDFFSVGSMPETTAIAIYYGVDRYDLSMVTDYEELLSMLSKDSTSLNNLYTFYFDSKDGLSNTTSQARMLLNNGSKNQNLKIVANSSNYTTLIPTNLSAFSPIILNFQASILPNISKILYPYSQNPNSKKHSQEDKNKMIRYLLSRLDYYRDISVKTLSEWKSQEKVYLADNNLETSWRGHRIYWHDNRREQITVNLGETKNVNRVFWTNWNHTLTPTGYTLLTSLNGQDWIKVKEVRGGERKDGELVEDHFSNTEARFVRMDITETLSNDAPAISEFEVVNSADENVSAALQFIQDPFNGIQNQSEMQDLLLKIAPLLHLSVETRTDKQLILQQIPIGQFNTVSNFSIILKPLGKEVKEIKVFLSAPLEVQIESAVARNLNLGEVQKLGAVKEFTEN